MLTPAGLVAISREGRGCPTGSCPWRSPTHARHARPSGAPPPGAHQRPCDLPDRPARSHQPHRLDPNRRRRARPPPANLQTDRAAALARPMRLGCRRALAPARSCLRARARFPCRARRGRPRPGWRRRALPGRLAAGGGGGRPGRGGGRGWVGGRQATPARQRPPRSAPAQGGGQPRRPAPAPYRWTLAVLVVAVDPGCGPGRRRQRARVQVACGEDWGGACTAPCSRRRLLEPLAEFHG